MKYDFCLNMNERRSQTLILKKIKPGSVVLELGPYVGVMTNYMKNVLNCEVYICEIDDEAFAIVSQYAKKAWHGDLETLGWADEFKDVKFDTVICADVLEHLKNPGAVLKATYPLLKDDGTVLTSIPNIAHNSVIYDLIHNVFEYKEYGIMDATHLRFFTYASAKSLCENAGYSPVEEDAAYDYFQVPASEQGLVLNKEYGNVLQFIFELKKTEYALQNNLNSVSKILHSC